MGVMALEGGGTWETVLGSLTSEISVASIVGVLSAVAAAVVGICFMWWAVRKATRALMTALKKGKPGL